GVTYSSPPGRGASSRSDGGLIREGECSGADHRAARGTSDPGSDSGNERGGGPSGPPPLSCIARATYQLSVPGPQPRFPGDDLIALSVPSRSSADAAPAPTTAILKRAPATSIATEAGRL